MLCGRLGCCCGWGEVTASAPVPASAQEARVQLGKMFRGNMSTSGLWFVAQHFARLLFWLHPHFSRAYWVFKRMCWGKLWPFQSMEATRKAFAMHEAEWHCKLHSFCARRHRLILKTPLWKSVGIFSSGTVGIKWFFLLSHLLLLGNHLHLDFASFFRMGKALYS